MSIKIVGIGSYLPEKILTNIEISKNVSTSDEWVKETLGINERRISEDDIFSSDLGVQSSLIAINDAGLKVDDIDFIIVATSSPDRISPSTASLLQEKLGSFNSACVDINAVCSGFLYGLQIAKGLLSTNQYKNILLVATETYSKITNWEKRDCVFFGDGSGSVILQKDDDGFCEIDLYTDGRGKESFTVHHGKKFSMIGKNIYNEAISKLPDSIIKLLKRVNINKSEISHIIPHQPSIKILKKVSEILDIDFNKFALSMNIYGNTAGASIPITLDKIYKEGKIKKNQLLLFTTIGSGLTWGSGLIKWSK